mgnify:CR=1 FL=1
MPLIHPTPYTDKDFSELKHRAKFLLLYFCINLPPSAINFFRI